MAILKTVLGNKLHSVSKDMGLIASKPVFTPGRRQSKTLIMSINIDQKSLETEFLIGICRPTGDKWQSKTLFLLIFDPRSLIVKSIFDCSLPGVVFEVCNQVMFK